MENRSEKLVEVDDDQLKRKDIKKFYVDSYGIHCIMLAEHEVFYNNWESERIFQVQISPTGMSGASSQPRIYKSVDISYVSVGDYDTFEVLLGTEEGQIFHTCMQYSSQGLQVIDDFVCVMEMQDFRPILDIKMAKIHSKNLILAVSDSCFYQFIGDYDVKSTFSEY
mmetsp:Transcript_7263/g.6393  ORF Transcript_7263/g.6393 Transcript_7263/m.6393 type:complete len:167 (+) Transcript_7263:357-857(+)